MLKEQLEQNQASLDAQKESMKLRIQYMYENRTTNTLVNFLESGSISEFLQRLEYMAQITAYDQKAGEKFEATQKEIEDTKIPDRIFRTEKYKNRNKELTACAQQQNAED